MEELKLKSEQFSFALNQIDSGSKQVLLEVKFNCLGSRVFSGFEKKTYICKRLIPIFYHQKTLPIIKENRVFDYCFLVLNPDRICGYARSSKDSLNLILKDYENRLIAQVDLTFEECAKWKQQTKAYLGDDYNVVKLESEKFMSLR